MNIKVSGAGWGEKLTVCVALLVPAGLILDVSKAATGKHWVRGGVKFTTLGMPECLKLKRVVHRDRVNAPGRCFGT